MLAFAVAVASLPRSTHSQRLHAYVLHCTVDNQASAMHSPALTCCRASRPQWLMHGSTSSTHSSHHHHHPLLAHPSACRIQLMPLSLVSVIACQQCRLTHAASVGTCNASWRQTAAFHASSSCPARHSFSVIGADGCCARDALMLLHAFTPSLPLSALFC